MAQVESGKIIDALAYKLGRMHLEATINEIALADAEATIAEMNEPSDPERDG